MLKFPIRIETNREGILAYSDGVVLGPFDIAPNPLIRKDNGVIYVEHETHRDGNAYRMLMPRFITKGTIQPEPKYNGKLKLTPDPEDLDQLRKAGWSTSDGHQVTLSPPLRYGRSDVNDYGPPVMLGNIAKSITNLFAESFLPDVERALSEEGKIRLNEYYARRETALLHGQSNYLIVSDGPPIKVFRTEDNRIYMGKSGIQYMKLELTFQDGTKARAIGPTSLNRGWLVFNPEVKEFEIFPYPQEIESIRRAQAARKT